MDQFQSTRVYTTYQIAGLLKVNLRTVQNWIKDGLLVHHNNGQEEKIRLTAYKIGQFGKYRINGSDINEFLDQVQGAEG